VGTWHDPDLGRPIAAPLERCAQLLGVNLATVRELAAKVEPYLRADGTKIWSLMQLERQLRPQAYGRRRGGYLDRRRTRTVDG
jgi:methionyl-tRNA synthetase